VRHLAVGSLVILTSVVAAFGTTSMGAAAQSRNVLNGAEQATVVDGVPLILSTPVQRSQCQKIANATHAAVPCPGLIPDPIPTSQSSANCIGGVQLTCGTPQIENALPFFSWNQMSFQDPPGYVGVPGESTIDGESLGHFVVYSGKNLNLSRTRTASPIPVYCARTAQNRKLRVHGVVARMYKCSNSSNGKSVELDIGHEVLIWKQNGITCEVSLHGHSQVNQDLDLVIANATRFVFPVKR
jgi:hypothetical protein